MLHLFLISSRTLSICFDRSQQIYYERRSDLRLGGKESSQCWRNYWVTWWCDGVWLQRRERACEICMPIKVLKKWTWIHFEDIPAPLLFRRPQGCYWNCQSWKLNYKPKTWHWKCNVSFDNISVMIHQWVGQQPSRTRTLSHGETDTGKFSALTVQCFFKFPVRIVFCHWSYCTHMTQ